MKKNTDLHLDSVRDDLRDRVGEYDSAADRLDGGTDAQELGDSVWRVRELGEEFDYNVNLEYICKGKRL